MKIQRFVIDQKVLLLVLIIIMVTILGIFNPVFVRIDNIMDVLKSYSILGMMACGMLLVILSGGIDVSIAAVISVSSYIVGLFLVYITSNIFLAFLVGCTAGAILGLINGLIITKLRIPPIVATLASLTIINGILIYNTGGKLVTGIPDDLIKFGSTRVFQIPVPGTDATTGIPVQAFFLLGVALLTWFISKYTLIGRGVYAIGGDIKSAERVGYNIPLIQILLYLYIGFIGGLSGTVNTSILRLVDPKSFTGYELTVISVVVLGGANIIGGFGSVGGVLLGVLFMAVIKNGLMLIKVSTYFQQIVVGAAMLLAISIDAIRKNRIEKQRVRVDVE